MEEVEVVEVEVEEEEKEKEKEKRLPVVPVRIVSPRVISFGR